MNSSKNVAFVGIMSALMFLMMFLETYVFTFLIPLAPPCILSLSLAITLSIYDGKGKMFVGGTIMGVCSLVIAFLIGNPVFIFPWISVLPRIFIGIISFGFLSVTKKFTEKSDKNFTKKYLPYGISAIFGVITNTVLVLFTMYLFKFIGLEDIVATFLAINFPLEVIGCAIIVPILVNTVKRFAEGK